MSTTTDATDQLLAGLNPAQREAVTLPDGPALVIAGAGSGKTRVLTSRIGYLLAEGRARPHEVLAITFTNRAAGEMRERVDQLVGASRGMWVMTFHAACGRILRREADRLGYRSNFTIYDQADQVRVVRACLEELGRDPKRFPPRGIHSRISSEKNRLVSATQFRENIGNFFEQVVADVFELYERRLHASNAMDFDDLLVRSVELLESFDDVRERWQGAFNHLLVDEYQDTNHAQYRIVRLLSDAHRNVFVVGDVDQAIYTWRGADIRNILDFERDFPDARIVRLEQNYRSSQRILDAANAVIENNAGRIEKRLWSDLGTGEPIRVIEAEDEHDEARIVAARIGGLLEGGASASDIAVFYRTNAQSRVLEDLLVRHGVPYQVIGGPRFYERAEIKDAMAYLSVLDNPSDEIALRRIVNQPRRGIGDASVDRLAATAGFSGRSLWNALEDPEGAGLGTAAARSVRAFRGLMDDLRDRAVELPVGDLLELLLERNGVIELLEAERTIEATGRIENLQELVGVAREYVARSEEPSLAGFLQEVSLTADADALAADENGSGRVTLMTLHNAKGLEFDAVFVIGMEQNLFPHARSIEEANIEEERRLCYVAITRARRELALVYARQRTLFGARGFNAPSQFIAEIPENLIEHERRPAAFGSTVRGGSGGGWQASSAGATTQLQGIAPRDDAPQLSVGDNVVHDQLGEGVVTGTADGGQVIVRFRSDGSERRLLLAYAPLKRL
ncbi:MAG: ATP-dependent helicase UvrD/PcrA [Gaiellales bacterium]|nr:ATP-dependent helicase UvrD/PcrA [Gaiellales bacterium]